MTEYSNIPLDNRIEVHLGGGSLVQIANRSASQMMSYLIETPDGKTVMIDSGYADESVVQHLLKMLCLHGNRVDIWFVTHAHNDHFGCLHEILKNYTNVGITIGEVCFSFPPEEWLCTCEPNRAATVRSFFQAIEHSGVSVRTPQQGETVICGGMDFEIIRDSRDYALYHSINDTSLVILAKFPRRSVLFLGDLGEEAGQDLLAVTDESKLRCDIVQMAHHGQNGVGRAFYEAVCPKICLYPASQWLWDCDNGHGKGSDTNLKTLETRRWMREFGVEKSYVASLGDFWLR